MSILSKNLKYLRIQKGLSQDQLADMLGYKSFTTMQKWEDGTSEPSVTKNVYQKLFSTFLVLFSASKKSL